MQCGGRLLPAAISFGLVSMMPGPLKPRELLLDERYAATAASDEAAASVVTRLAAAKMMDVSKPAFERARAIETYAPELKQDVLNKKITLSAAADKARDKARAKKPERKPRKSTADVLDARAAMFKNNPPLTPEQVDPDFKGTPIEFVTKYGHVQVQTAAQKEMLKQKFNISDWTDAIARMAVVAKKILELPDIDAATWNEIIALRKERLAGNLTVIDQAMERIRTNGMRSSPNGKGRHDSERPAAST